MKYLLVEDNPELANAICSRIKLDGHVIDHADKLADAIAYSETGEYDLILLDIMLPDGDGRNFLKHHRNLKKDTPVIVLTARSQVSDRISILDLGADDYVTKPFSVRELILRVKVILKKQSEMSANEKTIEYGPILMNLDAHNVTVDGKDIILTALEFKLLKHLLKRRGRVQTRDQLLADVWGLSSEVTTRTVDTHIKRLREKLDKTGNLIQTIRGVGYRFNNHT